MSAPAKILTDLSPIAAVLLEAFLTDAGLDAGDLGPDDVEYQRRAALSQGARERARYCGAFDHSSQAAALLVNIEELNGLLDGAMSGPKPLSVGEREAVTNIRKSLSNLLNWHFQNGARELLPIAKELRIDGYAAAEFAAS